MTDVTTMAARETLAAFRAGTLSPVEHVRAHLDRIVALNPAVNAIGDVYADDALAAAVGAEERYRIGDPRPLEGLLVAVKDEAEMAGRRTTNGSLIWRDWVGERNEPMVERILDAGGIIHARTLTPEFSIAFWTSSRLWGETRNPWNPAYDVGGSSGGSAAALAAGMTPLATGSDIGGSIRVPASCCGVVGYKPTYGRIPQAAPYGLDHWCHLGPLARHVADAALLSDVLTGPHRCDNASLRPSLRLGDPDPDVRGLRVALSLDLGDWPVVESVRSAVTATATALRDAGATVEEVPITIERTLLRRASDAHYAAVFAASVRATIADRENDTCHYTRSWLDSLSGAPPPLAGLAAEGRIQERLASIFETNDVLLCPAMAIPAFLAGVDYTAEPLIVNGEEFDPFRDICLTEVFNAASRHPVVTVPAGRDPVGVPIGVQVAARTYDDSTAIRAAAAIEAARPWPTACG
jgi:aspartyl-tRNA(Asn)/glutamyl-tRNA(Gln) amidotransferase subunit A